jgi:Family of unknown function (DUF6069)
VVEAYAALVKATGVPMSAGFLAASHLRPVTAGSFATGVLVCTFWGTALAVVLSKLSGRPRHYRSTYPAAHLPGRSVSEPT